MPKVILKDYYVVLGVSRVATAAEVKKRYRKLAREIHPDFLGPDASNEDRREAGYLFRDIAEAYEYLSDPEKRKAVDLWLGEQEDYPGDFTDDFTSDFWRDYAQDRPVEVPDAGQYPLNGIWCWVEFFAGRYAGLQATVTVQLVDLFAVNDLGELPHGAYLQEVIAVDRKGDIVGRGHSLASLRFNIRRVQAEARRNEDRRDWRVALAKLEVRIQDLARDSKPVDRLWSLVAEARSRVESGVNSLREAVQRDAVVQALREIEKEIQRVVTDDAAEILLRDLLNGSIGHADLRYNEELLQKLQTYEFRTNGGYVAPTEDDVQAYYRCCLAGLTDHTQVRGISLKLPDDEPTIQELVAEGAIELTPQIVQVRGHKGLRPYEVTYGYAKVGGELIPAGIITVPESIYVMNGAKYGQASQFPTLPYGITLMIRVQVKVQDRETLSAPQPDGKALQNEVQRCRARLRNPQPIDEYTTSSYLAPYPHF